MIKIQYQDFLFTFNSQKFDFTSRGNSHIEMKFVLETKPDGSVATMKNNDAMTDN